MINDFPRRNKNNNFLNEDLRIDNFVLFKIKGQFFRIYIITDFVLVDSSYCYITDLCILGSDNRLYCLDNSNYCFSKLEAFNQHKLFYKKLMKGFYNNLILNYDMRWRCPINE